MKALFFAILFFLLIPASALSYTYNALINCSNIQDTRAIVINGTSGFKLPGDTIAQFVYTNCNPGYNITLSYNNNSDYNITNVSGVVPFEVVRGLGSSYLPRSVYNASYVNVWHFENLLDSTGNNNLSWTSTPLSSANCIIGNCSFLNASYLQTLNNSASSINGASNRTIILWALGLGFSGNVGYFYYGNSAARQDLAINQQYSGSYWYNRVAIYGTDWDISAYQLNATNPSWQYYAYSYDSKCQNLARNASQNSGSNCPAALATAASKIKFGNTLNGYVDEMFILNFNATFSFKNTTYQNFINTAGFGNLQTATGEPPHILSWLQYPPNITFAKGQTITRQINATCTNSDISDYDINDTGFHFLINDSGYFTNTSIGSNRGFFPLNVTAFDLVNNSISGLFWVNLTCSAVWGCAEYGACNGLNITPCLSVSDSWCGDTFTGNISSYDGSCVCNSSFSCSSFGACNVSNIKPCLAVSDTLCGVVYDGPLSAYDGSCAWTNTSIAPGFLYPVLDYTKESSLFIVTIFASIWAALLMMAYHFKNQHLGIMSFIFGVIAGFLILPLSIVGGFALMITSLGLIFTIKN
jgi:hypothetical protein